jgi:hypothetical protein
MLDFESPIILAAIIAASAALGSAFFAFVAALINASVARKNAILAAQISQRTKRAEFRQAWIDKLRESLVKAHIGFANPKGVAQEDAEHALRTLLLVNRNDVDYARLSNCIFRMTNSRSLSAAEAEQVGKEMLEVSQDLLKREWNVVKSEIDKFDDDARKMKLFGKSGKFSVKDIWCQFAKKFKPSHLPKKFPSWFILLARKTFLRLCSMV